MKTLGARESINLKVVRFELDFTTLASKPPTSESKAKEINIPKQFNVPKERRVSKKKPVIPSPPPIKNCKKQKRDVKELVEALLDELYADQRDWSGNSAIDYSHGSTSVASLASSQSFCDDRTDAIERSYLEGLVIDELLEQSSEWEQRLQVTGERLARCVRARDRLRRQQKRLCAAFTVLIRHISTGRKKRAIPAVDGSVQGVYIPSLDEDIDADIQKSLEKEKTMIFMYLFNN